MKQNKAGSGIQKKAAALPAIMQVTVLILLATCISPLTAQAHPAGEQMDKIADVMSWVALVLAPTIGIAVFLLVHILPEKIAEKKNHPQAHAIKILCMLSLVFGGLLWPLAWLWAYTKPVFYKMAYGTDKGDYHEPTFKDLAIAAENKKAAAEAAEEVKNDEPAPDAAASSAK